MNFFDTRGKVAVLVLICGFLIAGAIFMAGGPLQYIRSASAQSTATTTVNILNIPPNWTVNPYTYPASNSSTPTNAGSNVTWYGVATSPNNNNVYLLICSTSSQPTAECQRATDLRRRRTQHVGSFSFNAERIDFDGGLHHVGGQCSDQRLVWLDLRWQCHYAAV